MVVLDVAVRRVLYCTGVVPLKLVTPEFFKVTHAILFLVWLAPETSPYLPGLFWPCDPTPLSSLGLGAGEVVGTCGQATWFQSRVARGAVASQLLL